MDLEKKTEKLSKFSYIATNPSSGVVRGELRAIGEGSALLQLERLGLDPISVSEKKESILDLEVTFFEKVKPTDIYNFTRQLSVMLKAGVPVVDALDSVHSDQTNPLLNRTLDAVIDDVSGGISLSRAMEKHPKVFNSMFVNIVRAGERAGVLDQVMLQLADFIAHDLKLRMGITQAIRYPSIVVGITMLVGVFAVTYILPRFTTLFSSTRITLPLPTRILLGIDQFINDHWMGIIFFTLFFIFVFLRALNTKPGLYQWHKFILNFPIFGPIAQKMAISRFCHVLDTLDRTGVPILEALDIAGKTAGNTFIEDRLAKVHTDVEMGKKVALSINRHTHDIFPPHVLKMIQVGEDAGAMDDMLSEIGDMTDAEVQDRVLKLTASLEPLITVFMGVMILMLALSIFLPIWDMYEALAKG
ncbi:MAG: type II secretion system F family protein [Candidatus Marinimicrobia bacterium]|nr:type II secretion system F family protein [Candidatus Neomarinimicrobiota bacterium]